MRLVSLYIDDHFLFEEPQTLNFGGNYFYEFFDATTITRKDNSKFIDNFYSENTIQLVSAIVGKNGTGKTTILKAIIEALQNRLQNYATYTAIFEDGEDTYLSPINHYNKDKYLTTFKYEPLTLKSQTLYYSPFLDFKEPIDGIDLSYDTILENDSIGKIDSIPFEPLYFIA